MKNGERASRIEIEPGADLHEACRELGFADPLPVVPPTVERVERCLAAVDLEPGEVVGLVAPNYGRATVEKIAANAVMAGCEPALMRVLIPAVRAACDERFDLHGLQATTHFAAPLTIINGPARDEFGFASGAGLFGNVAAANSTLGRALQLIFTNLGGARPGEIDMSTMGNPGRFSFCIAENEEASPWEPLHVERGLEPGQSAVTMFACEPPHGVSEHTAREGRQVLRAISFALRSMWSWAAGGMFEALVAIGPEHARTLERGGWTKAQARDYLFEHAAIPERDIEDEGGAGTRTVEQLEKVMLGGEPHYRKFREPGQIHLIVAGGEAGKFSAVLGGWLGGPRGSQMVTYPIE